MRRLPVLICALLAGCESTPAPAAASVVAGAAVVAPDWSAHAPRLVASGSFQGEDRHYAAGRALLYRLGDGSHLVRLEDLDVDNGSELRVWLTRDLADPSDGHTSLGALRSTRGDQNYAVPARTDLSAVRGVTVWGRTFSVRIGTAPF